MTGNPYALELYIQTQAVTSVALKDDFQSTLRSLRVSEQLAPWTISPRQLAPNLQTTSPLVLLSTTKPNKPLKYETKTYVIQIIFRSFIHYGV